MRATAVVMGALVAALTFGTADAAMRIKDDMGGLMTDYASRFANMRQSGEKVVIDGPCYSACTMLLGMLSREQVCVTPNAVLGFHAAWNLPIWTPGHQHLGDPGADRHLSAPHPLLARAARRAVAAHEVSARLRARVDLSDVPLTRVLVGDAALQTAGPAPLRPSARPAARAPIAAAATMAA